MKVLRKILTVILIASMIFGAVSCDKEPIKNPDNDQQSTDNTTGNTDETPDENENGNENNNENTDEDEKQPVLKVDYTVTVLTADGDPLSGITVFVHEDNGKDYNVCTTPSQTGKDGKVTFKLEEGKLYSVGLVGVPDRYITKTGNNRDNRYALDTRDTTVTLELNEDYIPALYRLGDKMANFTVTDIEGNTYELYKLLEEKECVVLNFWFAACGPCRSEFPAMNTAYNEYKDSIEILAINDTSESLATVQGFENKLGMKLDMPLLKDTDGSKIGIFRFNPEYTYPTTVVIDRYGKIVFMHVGAVTSVAKWESLFAFITAEDYTTTVIKDINSIPTT